MRRRFEPDDPFAAPRTAALVASRDWRGLAAAIALPEVAAFCARMIDLEARPGDFVILHHHVMAGRIEHFHHFTGALLLPLMQAIDIGSLRSGEALVTPDCGPMNVRTEELATHFGFPVAFYPHRLAKALERIADRRQMHLAPYDKSNDSDFFMRPHQVERVRRVAFAFAGIGDAARPAGDGEGATLLIERAPPLPYYGSAAYPHRPNPEGLSGADRRSIANIDALEAALAAVGPVRRLALEGLSLREQIRVFASAGCVVAQHGAGLNGLLWARPGTPVVEIVPTTNLGNQYTFFANIAAALELRHYHVIQATPHGPVDAVEVVALARAERRGCGSGRA